MQAKNLLLKGFSQLTLFLLVTSAYAVPPLPGRWYAEGSVGGDQVFSRHINEDGCNNVFNNVRCNNKIHDLTFDNKSNAAANANLGYKLLPFFGVEIGGIYLGEANLRVARTRERLATVKTFSYGAAAKFFVPIGCTGLQFFGKIGAQQLTAITHLTQIGVPATVTTPTEIDTETQVIRDFTGNNIDTNVSSTLNGTTSQIDTINGVPITTVNGTPSTNVNGNLVNGTILNNGQAILDANGNVIGFTNGLGADQVTTTEQQTIIHPSTTTTGTIPADNPDASRFCVRRGRQSKIGAWYGLGLQYFFTPPLAGVIEWQRIQGNEKTGSFNLWSAGIMFIIY